MGSGQFCFCCNRNINLICSLLLLLVSTFVLLTFHAQGRAITKLLQGPVVTEEGKTVAVRSRTIGSRPPRCEDKKCDSCGGHCEAVQVPVTAQAQKQRKNNKNHPTPHLLVGGGVAYTSGEDFSNYKPMSWKCKCGNFIFNP